MTGKSRKTFVRSALVALGAGALMVAASGGTAIAQGETVEFEFTGDVQQYPVPAGVCTVEVTAVGAEGGSIFGNGEDTPGGLGGEITARIAVTPGSVLDVLVGGEGGDVDGASTDFPIPPGEGGEPGAGDGGETEGGQGGAGGGGGSAVGFEATETLLVGAGGGGGAGSFNTNPDFSAGGDGGGENGEDGKPGFGGPLIDNFPAGGGGGGTQTAGGDGGAGGGPSSVLLGGPGQAGDVEFGRGSGGEGGDGGEVPSIDEVGGGGGGSGWHGGGGGGGAATLSTTAGGGGGGSNGAVGEILANDQGVQAGDGFVSITPIANTCALEAVVRFTG